MRLLDGCTLGRTGAAGAWSGATAAGEEEQPAHVLLAAQLRAGPGMQCMLGRAHGAKGAQQAQAQPDARLPA